MDLRNPGLPKSSKKPGRKHSDFDLDPNPAVALLDLEWPNPKSTTGKIPSKFVPLRAFATTKKWNLVFGRPVFGLLFRPFFRCIDQKTDRSTDVIGYAVNRVMWLVRAATSQAEVFATFFRTQFVSAGAGRWERHRALPAAVACFASKKKSLLPLKPPKTINNYPICSMYGIFTYITGWFCSGKCWYIFQHHDSHMGMICFETAKHQKYYQWSFQDPKMEVLYHIVGHILGVYPLT